MQMRDALQIIEPKVARMASILAKKAVKHGNIPAVGRTHGQHASIIFVWIEVCKLGSRKWQKHVETNRGD